MKKLILTLSLMLAAAANAAVGDTRVFKFDAPSTGNPSQNPTYPSLLTLTMTETLKNGITGVTFNLSGNGTDPSTGFSSQSFFEKLDFVYKGANLSDSAFSFLGGQSIKGIDYNSGNTMDSGYKSLDQHIVVNWNSPKDVRMSAPDSSSWFIAGTTLGNFETSATAANKPSPTFGILSATSYSLDSPKPTPSNWVTTAAISPVPESSTWAMFMAGLGAVGFVTRRRKVL